MALPQISLRHFGVKQWAIFQNVQTLNCNRLPHNMELSLITVSLKRSPILCGSFTSHFITCIYSQRFHHQAWDLIFSYKGIRQDLLKTAIYLTLSFSLKFFIVIGPFKLRFCLSHLTLEKAFDYVEWYFLFAVLWKINWRALYIDNKSKPAPYSSISDIQINLPFLVTF